MFAVNAVLNFTEVIGAKVEEVGFKYVPGFHRFDRAMQVVADKLNLALGLEVENAGETIVPQSQIRSDML